MDEFSMPAVEVAGVPIKKYDRMDVAEHVGFARLFWVNGKRFLVVEGVEDDIFEIVLKSNGYSTFENEFHSRFQKGLKAALDKADEEILKPFIGPTGILGLTEE